MRIYSDQLAIVQVVTNCRYFIVQNVHLKRDFISWYCCCFYTLRQIYNCIIKHENSVLKEIYFSHNVRMLHTNIFIRLLFSVRQNPLVRHFILCCPRCKKCYRIGPSFRAEFDLRWTKFFNLFQWCSEGQEVEGQRVHDGDPTSQRDWQVALGSRPDQRCRRYHYKVPVYFLNIRNKINNFFKS